MMRMGARAIWLFVLVWSAGAQALGLGPIAVRSHLNEPLDATIRLIDADPSRIDTLAVFLADPDQFRKAGLPRPFVLALLQFTVVSTAGQDPVIKVSSLQPIREPVLDFLLEVTSPQVRVVQQYTVLLDPALGYSPPPAAGKSPAATAAPIPASPAGGHYGPVTADDTLWSLAKALRPDPSISIQQMMLALLQGNPDAFAGGRLDGLKKGVTLRVPTAEEIRTIPADEAREKVRKQTGN